MDQQDNNYLEYKEHQEFFRQFYDIRRLFFTYHSKAYLSDEFIMEAFGKMLELTNWCFSQIQEYIDTEQIIKKRNEIIKEIKAKNTTKALDEMIRFINMISKYQQDVEILPKPKKEEKENLFKDLDIKTRIAYEGWTLVNAQ